MTKVLLISPNWRDLGKIGRFSKHSPHPALEMLYISASLDKEKINNQLLDLWAEDKSLMDYSNLIKESDIAVIDSAPSYTFWRDGTLDAELSRIEIFNIKKINPKIKIIVIGPHGTVFPKTFFDTEADYILRGEPDLEAVNLIKEIRENKQTRLDTVCFKKGGEWITREARANVDDMEKLPIIPYEKINFGNYCWPKVDIGGIKTTMVYETSRGCPYNCIFCFREGFRGKFRRKSIEKIGKDLDKLKGRVDYVYLIDEIFGINKEWAELVGKELKKRGLKWGCETRPECLDKDFIDKMAVNGCVIIQIGLESANKEVLKELRKETINLEKLKDDINYAVEKGINIKLYCTAGSPKETKESIKDTLNYVLQFDLEKVNAAMNNMIPYPETPLWELGKKEGRKLENWGDISKNIGVIGNNFGKPENVIREVAKFNAHILKRKAVIQIKKSLKNGNLIKIPKSLAVYAGCIILLIFPGLFNLFYRFYRFI